MVQPVSRRAFLETLGIGTGAIVLTACGVATPSAPSAATAVPPAAGAAGAPTSAAGATAAQAQPKAGGKLIAGKLGDAANLDGHYWSPNGGLHVWLSYDTLARYDENLKPQPQLAESWDVSSDFQTVTLNLRKGVTFHSGRELTA